MLDPRLEKMATMVDLSDSENRKPTELKLTKYVKGQKWNEKNASVPGKTDSDTEIMTEVLFKVIIIGDPTVGKTSFVQKYVNDSFRRDYKMTIGVDFALKVIKWSNKCNIKLQLWDIAGQERFTSMTRVYYKDAHACLVMFDLTQKNTFQNAIRWKKDLDQKCTLRDGSSVPCLLIANKCDIVDNREVSQDEIEDLCREHDFLGWSETSVKEGTMIEESMGFLIEEMMTKHSEMEDFTDSYQATPSNPIKLGKDEYSNNGSKCRC